MQWFERAQDIGIDRRPVHVLEPVDAGRRPVMDNTNGATSFDINYHARVLQILP